MCEPVSVLVDSYRLISLSMCINLTEMSTMQLHSAFHSILIFHLNHLEQTISPQKEVRGKKTQTLGQGGKCMAHGPKLAP